jgi:hypothetical protein
MAYWNLEYGAYALSRPECQLAEYDGDYLADLQKTLG